jgi:hypothetical protein
MEKGKADIDIVSTTKKKKKKRKNSSQGMIEWII